MQPRLGVGNHEFAHQVWDRKCREMRAHGPPDVMQHPWWRIGRHELIEPNLGFTEAIDRQFPVGGREQVITAAEVWQLLEHLDRVVRERDDVRGIHLHALGWDAPLALVEIELRPPRFCDLALALAGENKEPYEWPVWVTKLLRNVPQGSKLVVRQHSCTRLLLPNDARWSHAMCG